MTMILWLALQSGGWSTVTLGGEEVEVYRDRWGIPHVFARTVAGAFRAEGYTEAQDRLWQMETVRRAAKGRLAELRGRAGLGSDRDLVRRGYTEEELRRQFEACGERTRAILSAYAEGVNAWIDTGTLPPPYAALGLKPEPWSVTDCIAIGVLMARRFGEAGDIELTGRRVYDELVSKVGEEDARKIVADLLKENDPTAPATLHDHLRPKPPGEEKGFRAAPGMSDEAWARRRAEFRDAFASRAAAGVPVYSGSNAWVIAGRKSATGNPMLYGGPMMGFGTPSICNEIHLVADGLDVAGMSFPGVPGVMIGWNRNLAWTTTSGGADLVDVYTLELNPEDPEQYRWKGGWRRFEIVEREIAVRGAEPERVRVYRSVHGPLAGAPDRRNHRAHALRMSFWMKEHRTMEGVFDMNIARTVEAFGAAARKIVTSHNFFCATREGHIGFWFCGAHPVRKEGHVPHLPQDGSGDMEWEGILPPEKWPQAVDPPHGFFGNWNNKPGRDWPSVGYGRIFWGKKILDRLESGEKFTLDGFAAIARETAYHHFLADYFAPLILEAAEGTDDAAVARAADVLRKWDHQETEGSPAPKIMERWERGMMRRLFGRLVNPLYLASRQVQRYAMDPMLYALEGERSPVHVRYDYLQGREAKSLIVEALREAVKPGLEKLSWVEPEIDFGGAVGKVKSKKGRGTYQMAVEMTPEGPRPVTLCAPGQSEDSRSPHHADQTGLFRNWEYKPFVLERVKMERKK